MAGEPDLTPQDVFSMINLCNFQLLEPALRTPLVRLCICRLPDPHVLTVLRVEPVQRLEGPGRQENPINFTLLLRTRKTILRFFFLNLFLRVRVETELTKQKHLQMCTVGTQSYPISLIVQLPT